jgi:hypothetical protein
MTDNAKGGNGKTEPLDRRETVRNLSEKSDASSKVAGRSSEEEGSSPRSVDNAKIRDPERLVDHLEDIFSLSESPPSATARSTLGPGARDKALNHLKRLEDEGRELTADEEEKFFSRSFIIPK